jgi:hypothetical protein
MGIPRRKIWINLNKATPTELTVSALKDQLTAIGLTCPASEEGRLSEYITEVKGQIPDGQTQTYGITAPVVPPTLVAPPRPRSFAGELSSALDAGATGMLQDSSTGNWEPDPTGDGYQTTLSYIQYETHFQWLKANRASFTGVIDNPPPYTGKYASVDAIKTLFIQVGVAASATLVNGLDKASMESVLSNAIAPLSDSQASNYDPGWLSRVIFLVENYDPSTQNADGVGVLTIEWHLTIKDYREKSKDAPQHDTSLTIKARSVLYSSVDDMMGDFNAALAQFGTK